MSEEQTERFEGSTPFEIRVLRELADLRNRLTTLEEKVDTRLKDTRPIWESVLAKLETMDARLDGMDARFDSLDSRLEGMDARLEKVEDKFATVADELLDMRSDISRVKKRLPAA